MQVAKPSQSLLALCLQNPVELNRVRASICKQAVWLLKYFKQELNPRQLVCVDGDSRVPRKLFTIRHISFYSRSSVFYVR